MKLRTTKTLKNKIPEIRKRFSFGRINPISNPDKYKRPYISIIRQIPKMQKIICISCHI
jgi:hypothetical protein